MTRRWLILSLLMVILPPECFSQINSNDERLRQIILQDGQALVTIPYTGRQNIDLLTRKVSILSVDKDIITINLSAATVEWFILQKYDYQIVPKAENKGVRSAMNLREAMAWDSYPTYTQYDSIMRSFATLYPALCRIDTIGRSVYGKLVLALKISDNAAVDEDEPEVFYSSTIHGDETSGFILMLRFADYLLKNYASSSRVKDLTDNLEIWINPLANPDGTYKTGNTINSPLRYNANNFDLNRNFPDPITPYNSSHVQQKETIDMVKFLRKHRFVISANFHSGVEVVNYPWDKWYSKLHADNDWFHDISRAYADTVHKYSGPTYMNYLDNGITRGADWYPIFGGRQDFVTWELQGREVTIELDNSYVTPTTQLPLLWEYNYRSFLEYLENALHGIHGKVLDDVNNNPVAAKIFIPGHDIDSSHVYSDTLTGNFVRLLSAGSYNIAFSAKGYHDTIVSNVFVLNGQRTDLTVNMVPIMSTDTTLSEAPVLYPNPASIELKAILSTQMAGSVNIRIYNQTGKLMTDYDAVAEKDAPVIIDVRHLSPGVYTVIFTKKPEGTTERGRFVKI